ncbi:hypothetical protein SKAU_G00053360 [Synaphobranchus kaupii]|uniref:Uncharacterized protein n=1 Tax=Synaphobranchus kaupii TaxID=118154 RepID=A0A9Q1G3Y1_SYNKA|nr:hypothetical protein SKAU_G00053360 [Synaphobranchus kaupii]
MNRDAAEVPEDPFAALSEEQRKSHGYPVLVPCCIQDWASQIIDYQTNGDPRLVNYCTTYTDHFQRPTSFDDISSTIIPVKDSKKNQQEVKLPGSSPKSPLIKYTAPQDGTKIQQYRLNHPLRSAYSDTYKFRWCAPPKAVMQSPAFTMGDPERIRECETSYSAHFSDKGRVSSEVINQTHEHQLINLGDYPTKWKTTTSDVHPSVKTAPVLLIKKDRNFSSVPKGDMDPERNRARMTATSYKFFFSKNNPKGPLVRIDGPAAMTKSNVVLGQVGKEGLSYTSTSSVDYPRRTAVRVMPFIPAPGYGMATQATGPKVTTMQADYRPVKGTRHSLRPEQLELPIQRFIRKSPPSGTCLLMCLCKLSVTCPFKEKRSHLIVLLTLDIDIPVLNIKTANSIPTFVFLS